MKNPYRPKTMKWALIEEDWSDLSMKQIAEVFGSTYASVQRTIVNIKKETGYEVPYRKRKAGRPKLNEY